jgi:hypothetical protein
MRRLSVAILVVATGLCALLPVAVASGDDELAEAWETVLGLRINNGILMLHLERDLEFEFPEEWIPMRSFSKNLPEMFRSRLVTRDGWNHDFLVGSVREQLIVVSGGQNGVSETVEQLSSMSEDEDRGLSFGDQNEDDIVLLVGDGVVNGPKTVTGLLRVAMADLRSIGTAVESYSIDVNTYPLQTKGLQSVDFISPELSPVYLRTVVVEDPWGNQFLYWSDQTSYILVSMGADGVLDRPYEIKPGWLESAAFVGEYVDPDQDMIFAKGQFVQWPARRGR